MHRSFEICDGFLNELRVDVVATQPCNYIDIGWVVTIRLKYKTKRTISDLEIFLDILLYATIKKNIIIFRQEDSEKKTIKHF